MSIADCERLINQWLAAKGQQGFFSSDDVASKLLMLADAAYAAGFADGRQAELRHRVEYKIRTWEVKRHVTQSQTSEIEGEKFY